MTRLRCMASEVSTPATSCSHTGQMHCSDRSNPQPYARTTNRYEKVVLDVNLTSRDDARAGNVEHVIFI